VKGIYIFIYPGIWWLVQRIILLKREFGTSIFGNDAFDVRSWIERVWVGWFEAVAIRGSIGLATKVVPHKAGVTLVCEARVSNIGKHVVFTVNESVNPRCSE